MTKTDLPHERKQAVSGAAHEETHKINQAIAFHQTGQLAKAKALYEDIVASQPDHVDALHLLGVIAAQTQNYVLADELIGKAIAINPNNASFYHNRGNALKELRQFVPAISNYDTAISLEPNYAEAYCNRGRVLQELAQFEAALTSFDTAIKIRPNYAEAHFHRGAVLATSKQFEAAANSYMQAISYVPTYADAYANLGTTLRELERLDDAIANYDTALSINPNHAQAHLNRGNALLELKQFQAAIDSFDKAIAIKSDYPDAHYNKSLALLMTGNLQHGWKLHEWRWQKNTFLPTVRDFKQPLWQGTESIKNKTILLYAEQGYGDIIQFCRYAKLVAELGASVLLEVPEKLKNLLRTLDGVSELIVEGETQPEFDFQCPLMSLPLAFNTTISAIPSSKKYLCADNKKVRSWSDKLGHKSKPRVGIAWSGNSSHKNDHNRSITLSTLLPLLSQLPGFDYISLQKVVRFTDQKTLEENALIKHFGDELDDFSDTAALCELMDIVVCVDTSVAHLSGALGKPTMVLLPHCADWRWLLDRNDSPWYPSLKLFRQQTRGDWRVAISNLTLELEQKYTELSYSPLLVQAGRLDSMETAHVQASFAEAKAFHANGDLSRAKSIYEAILRMRPDHGDAIHLLGVLSAQSGNYQTAIELIGKAISINPNDSQFYSNLGNAYSQNKQFEKAVDAFDKAIEINSTDFNAFSNRGNALRELKQLQAAIASFENAISIAPNYAESYYNRGNVLNELQQFEAALSSYEMAIKRRPEYVDAYINRGNILLDRGRFEEAIINYDQAISINPECVVAHYNRGNAFQRLKQMDTAINCYNIAIAKDPQHAEAYYNRGNALQELQQSNAAILSYDKAILIKSEYVEAYCNRGNILLELQQIDAAIASYNAAIKIKPEHAFSNYNKSLALLLSGDFDTGWYLYEWRFKCKESSAFDRHFQQPLWLGTAPLQGKTILLHSEQGLGDTIQFCRYAKLVKQLGANVLIEVPSHLAALFENLEGVDEVIIKGAPLPEFDYHCPLLSLALAFKTSLDSIPKDLAYLQSNPEKRRYWEKKLGVKSKPRIGLVWNGSATHKSDHHRSMPLSTMLQLTSHFPQYEFISLQKELRETDRDTLTDNSSILHFEAELSDFTDTAALCDLMDVVISIDTSVAHLSAALGKRTLILLAYAPDWRWLLGRSDSPWYPSVTLFRQTIIGDWSKVLDQLKNSVELNFTIPIPPDF